MEKDNPMEIHEEREKRERIKLKYLESINTVVAFSLPPFCGTERSCYYNGMSDDSLGMVD